MVAKYETEDIAQQKVLFGEWDKHRQNEILRVQEEIRVHQRKIAIAERLKELTEKEEKLRYFEMEDKIKVGIAKAPKEIIIEDVKEEETFVAAPSERGKLF